MDDVIRCALGGNEIVDSSGELSRAFATPAEHIVNGGFETGDFTGWTVTSVRNGIWIINDGTILPQVNVILPGTLGPQATIRAAHISRYSS